MKFLKLGSSCLKVRPFPPRRWSHYSQKTTDNFMSGHSGRFKENEYLNSRNDLLKKKPGCSKWFQRSGCGSRLSVDRPTNDSWCSSQELTSGIGHFREGSAAAAAAAASCFSGQIQFPLSLHLTYHRPTTGSKIFGDWCAKQI